MFVFMQDAAEAVQPTMTAMDAAPEPIPDHVKDAVLRAMESKDETILRALSPEDSEAAFRWLTSSQAHGILNRRSRPEHRGSTKRQGELAHEWRTDEEIRVAEQEMLDRLWYYRTLANADRSAGQLAEAEDKLREVEAKYTNLVTEDPFELGMLHGKLSALRWVLGDDWDMLDT
jgi:hypothetical protein